MVVLFFIILVLIVILAAVLEPVFGFGHDVAGYTAFAFVGGAFIAMFYFYFFTRKGRAIVRVWNIKELRKKRIEREFHESWNRANRKFIKKMERQDAREIRRRRPSADESSAVGCYGSDFGDGGAF